MPVVDLDTEVIIQKIMNLVLLSRHSLVLGFQGLCSTRFPSLARPPSWCRRSTRKLLALRLEVFNVSLKVDKRPTLVAKEVTSVCSCEVPPFGIVKVLWLTTSAHQLSQVFIVWVVVKGTNILAAADHVLHVWGVVDGGGIRQHPGQRRVRLRRPGARPLVSFNTG